LGDVATIKSLTLFTYVGAAELLLSKSMPMAATLSLISSAILAFSRLTAVYFSVGAPLEGFSFLASFSLFACFCLGKVVVGFLVFF